MPISVIGLALIVGCRSREPADRSGAPEPAAPLAEASAAKSGQNAAAPSTAPASGSSATAAFGELSRHPRLEHPIVLGGTIVGEARAGRFAAVDQKLIGSLEITEADSSPTAPFVRVPKKIRFYSAQGAVGELTPLRARVALGCAGVPELGFDFGAASPPREALIGLDATWDALPRRAARVSDHEPWGPKVKSLLDELGKPQAPVDIQRVERVDLAGDGRPETVVMAHHVEWREHCRALPRKPECTAGDEETLETAKSYGLVAVALDGEGPLRAAYQWLSGLLTTASDPGYVDTDADGTLELVIESRYYEGQYYRIVHLEGGELRTVLTGGCGL